MARHLGELKSFVSTKSLMQPILDWVRRRLGNFSRISTMEMLQIMKMLMFPIIFNVEVSGIPKMHLIENLH